MRAATLRLIVLLVATWIGAVPTPSADAEEHGNEGEYEVVQWTTFDGMPSTRVRALAETPDGYLWIGTEGGLARFDGLRFEVFDLATTPELGSVAIRALGVGPEGALWIGTRHGTLSRYHAGTFEAMGRVSEHPIRALHVDGDGTVWVGADRLMRYEYEDEDGRATSVLDRTVLDSAVLDLQPGLDGALWVLTEEGVVRVKDGTSTAVGAEASPPHGASAFQDATGLSTLPDGSLLVHGLRALVRLPEGRAIATEPSTDLRPWLLWDSTVDRLGRCWWGCQSGLHRLSSWGATKPNIAWTKDLRALPRESTGPVRAILEDGDGNIWVGSDGRGLLLLRSRAARPLEGRAVAVVPLPDGRLWTTVSGIPMLRGLDGRVERTLPELRGAHLSSARGGGVWIAHRSGYVRVSGNVVEHFPVPTGRAPPEGPIFEDQDGGLWWQDGARVTTRIEDGHVPAEIPGRVLGDAPDGALLLALGDGEWGWYREGHIEKGPPLPPAVTDIQSMLEDSGGRVWITGNGAGLACAHEGRVTLLTREQGLPHNVLGPILEDGERRLWINTPTGMFLASLDDLVATVEGTAPLVPCRHVTHAEMGAAPSSLGPTGRVYASTSEGYVEIDSGALPPVPDAPSALVESITIDGTRPETRDHLELGRGARNLRIAFTAPSPARGETLQFRHRMRGVDPDWIVADPARHAVYAKLPSGSYTFEVEARDGFGPWGSPATVRIDVPARFHERTWFGGALLLTGLALAFLLYRVRRRAIDAHAHALEAERDKLRAERAARLIGRRLVNAQEDERKRIAMELHDDVGQRLAVLALGLETRQTGTSELVDLTQDLSRDIHRLSRALHPARLERLGLVAALRGLGREYDERGRFSLTFGTEGDPGGVAESTALCLYRIAQEALSNVLQHSGATEVSIDLRFTAENVHLTISDDGSGFGPDARHGTGLGLTGMAERADAVGGRCETEARPGTGARIRVTVPKRGTKSG